MTIANPFPDRSGERLFQIESDAVASQPPALDECCAGTEEWVEHDVSRPGVATHGLIGDLGNEVAMIVAQMSS